MKFGKLVGLVALLLGLYLLWRVRFIVLLAFLAITLATVLNRVVQQLTRWRLKRGLAIAITFVAIFVLATVFLVIVVPPFIEQVYQWLNRVPIEAARISTWIARLDDWLPIGLSAQFQKLDMFLRDVPQVLRDVFSNFFILFRGTLSLVANFFLVLAVTVMLLANPKAYRWAFVLLFPQFYRYRVQKILDHCEKSLVAWGVGIMFNTIGDESPSLIAASNNATLSADIWVAIWLFRSILGVANGCNWPGVATRTFSQRHYE